MTLILCSQVILVHRTHLHDNTPREWDYHVVFRVLGIAASGVTSTTDCIRPSDKNVDLWWPERWW